ncbi:MAG: DnaJ domain-containing protein [Methylobacter sp.]|nr:DnaJ domain-containing protein [Methylobacter sp.]
MKTPYELLGVAADAADAEIKQAYLQKVKDNPPDRDQEQFQLIHNAYTSIKDSKSRMSYALFNVPIADFEELLDQALATAQALQIKPEHFNKLLHAGIDDATLVNALPHYSEKS